MKKLRPDDVKIGGLYETVGGYVVKVRAKYPITRNGVAKFDTFFVSKGRALRPPPGDPAYPYASFVDGHGYWGYEPEWHQMDLVREIRQ